MPPGCICLHCMFKAKLDVVSAKCLYKKPKWWAALRLQRYSLGVYMTISAHFSVFCVFKVSLPWVAGVIARLPSVSPQQGWRRTGCTAGRHLCRWCIAEPQCQTWTWALSPRWQGLRTGILQKHKEKNRKRWEALFYPEQDLCNKRCCCGNHNFSITYSPSVWAHLSCLFPWSLHRLRSGSAEAVQGWAEPSRTDPGCGRRRYCLLVDRCGAAAQLRNKTAGKQKDIHKPGFLLLRGRMLEVRAVHPCSLIFNVFVFYVILFAEIWKQV